jgi:aldehyde dehydrogenase (NAD+)
VHQELGGKSPNIILPDADIKRAVTAGVRGVMQNSGQSCNAPTRMLVPNAKMAEALAVAKEVAEATTVGAPDSGAALGPVISATQWDKIQTLIHKGIEEGAKVVAGGPGKPAGLETGYYVKPTVLGPVSNDKTVAREEIFDPCWWSSATTVEQACRRQRRPMAWRPMCRAATSRPRARWHRSCAPGRSTSTARPPT